LEENNCWNTKCKIFFSIFSKLLVITAKVIVESVFGAVPLINHFLSKV